MEESEITAEDIKNWFVYDYSTGKLFWKNPLSNRVKAGDEAGSIQAGYLRVGILGKAFQVHRIIWKLFYGDIPADLFIDHIDGNKLNNKLENLRLATYTENNRNAKSRNGKSKYKGVYWFKRDSCWQAQIQVDNVKYHIGYFDDEEEAAKAYEEVAKQIHGDFFNKGFSNDNSHN